MLTYGDADEAGRNVSTIMMDYWISFAVSLNPNDGKGIQRQLPVILSGLGPKY